VFTRSGGHWTQQGNKLVGTGANRVGEPPMPLGQGMSVALSADGNTAIVGGWSDNSKAGAAWVFIRSGGVWTQQGKYSRKRSRGLLGPFVNLLRCQL
jgi:hypothetical protein